MFIQTKQMINEVFGQRCGGDILTEFAKLDVMPGTPGTESANVVYAGPSSGSAAAATFRTLVAADIPTTLAAMTFTGNVSITGSFRTTGIVGFFNAAAVLQPTASALTTGFTAVNTTTVVAAASTFTGNIGLTAYTIGDVVNALKKLGLIAP